MTARFSARLLLADGQHDYMRMARPLLRSLEAMHAFDIEVLALDPRAATFTNPIPTPESLPAQPTPAPLPPPDAPFFQCVPIINL